MRRRRVAVGLVALAPAAVVAAALWPSDPRPGRATFGQVREGMSHEEVVATVGAPPGSRVAGERIADDGSLVPGAQETWIAPDVTLGVWFDSDGRAARVQVSENASGPVGAFKLRLRARLGL